MDSNRIIENIELRNALLADLIEKYIWEFKFGTNEFYVSPYWNRFLGYESEDVKENKEFWLSIIHPEDIKILKKKIQECKQRIVDIFIVEYRVKSKSGKYKWILSEAKVHYDKKQNPLSMVGYNLNLSDLKEKEDTNRKFHILFNNISDAVFILSSGKKKKPGSIIEVNLNAVKLTGFEREELIEKNILDISPVEFLTEPIDIEKEVIQKGECYFNAVIISKDNRKIPVEVNSTQVELDDEILHIAVVRDISERLSAQKTLRESEERSRKIVQMAPTGAIIYENDIITYINNAGARFLGATSKEELIGKEITSIIHKDYWEIAEQRRAAIKCGIIPEAIEMNLVRCDERVICAELYTMPINFKGKIAGLSYIKDITEQKRIFEEKQKLLENTLEYDRIKTEFFSNISHELRTPLNIILSSIQLLNSVYRDKHIKPEKFCNTYEKHIGAMKQNSYRLLKLINNLIDITKIDAGFMKMELRNQNIVDTIENISMSAVPYLESKGISLVFDTDIEEKIIAFDEEKMERILLNLLSNAAKFTEPGDAVHVIIKDEGDSINIIIKDTGYGIPEDKLHIIFDRFRQVDSLFTRRAEGSGIGLSLVKCLVEAHEGRIFVSSTLGGGSEFRINLPSKIVENNIESYKSKHEIRDNESKIELVNIEFSDIYK